MRYPDVYHKAVAHLVHFGAHNGDTNHGRKLIAQALWALRHINRLEAIMERNHLLYISGMFPVKRNRQLNGATYIASLAERPEE